MLIAPLCIMISRFWSLEIILFCKIAFLITMLFNNATPSCFHTYFPKARDHHAFNTRHANLGCLFPLTMALFAMNYCPSPINVFQIGMQSSKFLIWTYSLSLGIYWRKKLCNIWIVTIMHNISYMVYISFFQFISTPPWLGFHHPLPPFPSIIPHWFSPLFSFIIYFSGIWFVFFPRRYS